MTTHVDAIGRDISRRTLIAQAGVAGIALAGLSACSGGATGSAPPVTAGSTPPPAAGSTPPVTAKTGDIPVGSGTIYADAKAVITQPTAGEFKAFSSICTHAGCPVTEVTQTINCKCHGSMYSLTDGSPTHGPATKPLPARTVTVNGDSIQVS